MTARGFVALVGLLGLLGAAGCSRVLGIEEASLRPETGGAGGGAGASGSAGSFAAGTAGGAAGVSGGGGTGGATNCPIGTVGFNGQCCPLPLAGGVCNLPACGCAEDQICAADKPATGLQCFTRKDLAVGQACNAHACVTGAGCYGGVCKPYCQTDSDCAAIAGLRSCRPTTWYMTSDNIPGVNTCASICDPARPQSPRAPLRACPNGYRCWFSNDSKYSDCAPAGTAAAGQPCPNGNECAPGHYCTVKAICNRACGSAADCPAGEGCLEFVTTQVSLGGLKVGYCGNCDPARPDAPRTGLHNCPSGFTCALISGSVYECLKSKALGGEGDPCPNLHVDCKPGFYCKSDRTCHRYCADSTDCGGAACNDFTTPVTTSGQRVASCQTN